MLEGTSAVFNFEMVKNSEVRNTDSEVLFLWKNIPSTGSDIRVDVISRITTLAAAVVNPGVRIDTEVGIDYFVNNLINRRGSRSNTPIKVGIVRSNTVTNVPLKVRGIIKVLEIGVEDDTSGTSGAESLFKINADSIERAAAFDYITSSIIVD